MIKINKLVALVLLSFTFGCSSASKNKKIVVQTPIIMGEWQHIFNPNDTRLDIDSTWYTNDHCFTLGSDGKWHGYGIIGHAPINPWQGEYRLFHISADSFDQPKWEDNGYAMEVVKGVERVLWAPHVIEHDGVWSMFYNTGNMQESAPNYASWGQLRRADSRDMSHWERHPLNPLFSDAGHARDSYILKDGDLYYYYYTKTYSEVDLRSCVAVRTSEDLERWSGAQNVHVQPLECDWGGDAESPFVVKRDGVYYLFTCLAMSGYEKTCVYWSTDPLNFPIENLVCELPTHAAEVIKVSDDEWYISNTGWDKKGLFIAKLEWK